MGCYEDGSPARVTDPLLLRPNPTLTTLTLVRVHKATYPRAEGPRTSPVSFVYSTEKQGFVFIYFHDRGLWKNLEDVSAHKQLCVTVRSETGGGG